MYRIEKSCKSTKQHTLIMKNLNDNEWRFNRLLTTLQVEKIMSLQYKFEGKKKENATHWRQVLHIEKAWNTSIKRWINKKTHNSFIHYFKFCLHYLNFLNSSLTTSLISILKINYIYIMKDLILLYKLWHKFFWVYYFPKKSFKVCCVRVKVKWEISYWFG